MAQRNLTPQFKALREGFNARRGPRRRRNIYEPIESSDTNINEAVQPSWIEASEASKKLIEDINSKIKILNQLHKNRLLVRFDNSEQIKDKEIDVLTNEITNKFREAEKGIKSHLFKNQNEFVNKSNADYVVKENIKKQLAGELQQMSVIFRKSQKEYMQRLRSQKGHFDLPGMEDVLGSGKDQRGGNMLDSMLVDTLDTSEIVERDKEIQKIAQNVNELATIFQDLATLVIDQGTILDRIDYNLENVQIKTEQGLNELIIADKYSENSRPFKCILLLIGIITLEAVVLMAKSS